MAEARERAAAVLLPNGRILITGGEGANGLLASAEIFGIDGSFHPASSMHTARRGHRRGAAQGWMGSGGGRGDNWGRPTNSAEIYNPATDSWSFVGSMVEARAGHTAIVLENGRVLIAGGESAR
jgi:N-acetylneuraminic acid mutarotase